MKKRMSTNDERISAIQHRREVPYVQCTFTYNEWRILCESLYIYWAKLDLPEKEMKRTEVHNLWVQL